MFLLSVNYFNTYFFVFYSPPVLQKSACNECAMHIFIEFYVNSNSAYQVANFYFFEFEYKFCKISTFLVQVSILLKANCMKKFLFYYALHHLFMDFFYTKCLSFTIYILTVNVLPRHCCLHSILLIKSFILCFIKEDLCNGYAIVNKYEKTAGNTFRSSKK